MMGAVAHPVTRGLDVPVATFTVTGLETIWVWTPWG